MNSEAGKLELEQRTQLLQSCMYQYSRAIYRSVKNLVDPYSDRETQLASRRAVLAACEQTMERLATDPLYFAKPDRALFQDIRRYFPITAQAEVAWAVREGVAAAAAFIREQIEAGALDGGVARCRATTRKGKPCQRTPLPGDHAEGQAVPAHAAAGARLLPVAPAPGAHRAPQGRRLALDEERHSPNRPPRDRLGACPTTPTS